MGSKGSVDGVRWSPSGLLLAAGAADGTRLRLWCAHSGCLLRELAGMRLLASPGTAPGPWAAALSLEHAPFGVRLPELSALLVSGRGGGQGLQGSVGSDCPEVARSQPVGRQEGKG